MSDVFGAFATVIIGMAILAAVLGGLYSLTRYLPGGWRERGQVLVFVGPAVFLVFAGLFVPAVRTIVGELPRRHAARSGSGSTTTTRSSRARAPG